MSALTADRANVVAASIKGRERDASVAGGVLLFKGALIARNAAGHTVPAADNPGLRVMGIAQERVDNRAGGDGAAKVLYNTAISARLKNDPSNPVTQAMLYTGIAWVKDDQTVQGSSTNGVVAGIPEAFEPGGDVLVYVAAEVTAALTK